MSSAGRGVTRLAILIAAGGSWGLHRIAVQAIGAFVAIPHSGVVGAMITLLQRVVPALAILAPAIPLALLMAGARQRTLPQWCAKGASAGMATLTLLAIHDEYLRLAPWFPRYAVSDLIQYVDPIAAGAALIALLAATAPWLPSSRMTARRAPRLAGAADAIFGQDEFMGMDRAARLFNAPSGIVFGEAIRVDRTMAGVDYDPDNEATWGGGGSGRLLTYVAQCGSPHLCAIMGTGSGKTSGLILPTCINTNHTIVVFDPAREAVEVLYNYRRELGRRVIVMDPLNGTGGCNALDGLGVNDPKSRIRIRALAASLSGYAPGKKSDGDLFWKSQGTAFIETLILIVLATIPGATLRNVYEAIAMGADAINAMLGGTQEDPELPVSIRHAAGEFIGLPDKTFGSVLAMARDALHFLNIPELANMVCGSDFQACELPKGGLDLFMCIPTSMARDNPGLARVLVDSFVAAYEEADGHHEEDCLLCLDESPVLGALEALVRCRDQGRKFGLHLLMVAQSTGQFDEVWGREGRQIWWDNFGLRVYACPDLDTAKELEERCGSKSVIHESTSDGGGTSRAQGQLFGQSSSNESVSRQSVKVPVLRAAEAMQMRRDEQICIPAGLPPLRTVRAFYWRRDDMKWRVENNRFAR